MSNGKGDFLDDRRKSLEDAFFKKEEQKKVAKLREKLKQQTVREELLKASGMTDEGVLDKLVELGLTADTVVALSLCPLVHVAWADGQIQENEHDAILKAAQGKGIEQGDPAFALLSEWLNSPEPPDLLPAWSAYVVALGEEMTSDQYAMLKEQIIDFAHAVASAAGGVLGIKSISKAEKTALAEIARAFGDK